MDQDWCTTCDSPFAVDEIFKDEHHGVSFTVWVLACGHTVELRRN